jgi:ElaB/YqjD/DUF883 family membrane-anchored ribosome-binding protein
MKRTGQDSGFNDAPEHEGEGAWEREYPQTYGAYGVEETQGGGHRESTFKQIRSTVADKLQAAAQTLHAKADRPGQQAELTAYGHRAADWLERSADYVNEIEPQRIKSDLENQVRRNPGRSLLVAGIVGLALGGLLRRR